MIRVKSDFQASRAKSVFRETRASRDNQGYQAPGGNQDHRAGKERGVLMGYLALQALRVSLAIWGPLGRTASKDPRARSEREGYLDREEYLA